LVNHPKLGPWIRDYLSGEGIPLKGKVYAIGLMWASIGLSCYLVPLFWARAFMLTSAVLVSLDSQAEDTAPPRLAPSRRKATYTVSTFNEWSLSMPLMMVAVSCPAAISPPAPAVTP
jgi:hypothetical protein